MLQSPGLQRAKHNSVTEKNKIEINDIQERLGISTVNTEKK